MLLHDSCIARRRFLAGMLGGGAAALGACLAVPAAMYVANRQPEAMPAFLELEPADYELRPGSAKIVMYGRIPALLLQPPEPNSELKVFVAVCTHFDCTVGYRPDRNQIHCACHEGYYDLDGQVLAGPPPRPLRQFHTRRRDGKLVIALEPENLT